MAGVSVAHRPYLAQAGEFGFVLLSLAQNNGLVPPDLMNPILASMVLSMLATPFIIIMHSTIVMKLVSSEWLQHVADDHHCAASPSTSTSTSSSAATALR
jgi:CPA2 family monovalent cation:H+ antiporter-2